MMFPGISGAPPTVCGFSRGWVISTFWDGQGVEDSISTKASWEVVYLGWRFRDVHIPEGEFGIG